MLPCCYCSLRHLLKTVSWVPSTELHDESIYKKNLLKSLCFACNSQFSLSQVITGIFKNILVLFTLKSMWLSYNLHAINDAHFKGVEFHGFHQTYTIMNHNSNQI